MATREFTFEDIKENLVNRVGVPAENVVDDPGLSFEEIGLDSLDRCRLVRQHAGHATGGNADCFCTFRQLCTDAIHDAIDH